MPCVHACDVVCTMRPMYAYDACVRACVRAMCPCMRCDVCVRCRACDTRRGEARRGKARRGEARRGEVRRGAAMRCDALRCNALRCDAMRCDALRCDALRCDAMRCDSTRCDATRCDAMRCARGGSRALPCNAKLFLRGVRGVAQLTPVPGCSCVTGAACACKHAPIFGMHVCVCHPPPGVYGNARTWGEGGW